ncbi:MAG: hypothetical protein IJ188_06450 [Clostridia bacterium]|nr:hypothetical protein [Clostridia bacterium]
MPYVGKKYINYAYSYQECKDMVELCKKAMTDLIDGQAQEYTIGSRQVKFLTLQQAQDMMNYFSSELRKYEIGTPPPRSVAVVFRDT